MKTEQLFMMLFRFTPDSSYEPSEKEKAAMHEAWGSFIGQIAGSGQLASTYQLGFQGKKVHADLSVEDGIHIAENQTLGGNMVVKADSIEEATELAKKCPVLKAGGLVEIRSIMPMND